MLPRPSENIVQGLASVYPAVRDFSGSGPFRRGHPYNIFRVLLLCRLTFPAAPLAHHSATAPPPTAVAVPTWHSVRRTRYLAFHSRQTVVQRSGRAMQKSVIAASTFETAMPRSGSGVSSYASRGSLSVLGVHPARIHRHQAALASLLTRNERARRDRRLLKR